MTDLTYLRLGTDFDTLAPWELHGLLFKFPMR